MDLTNIYAQIFILYVIGSQFICIICDDNSFKRSNPETVKTYKVINNFIFNTVYNDVVLQRQKQYSMKFIIFSYFQDFINKYSIESNKWITNQIQPNNNEEGDWKLFLQSSESRKVNVRQMYVIYSHL